MSYYIITYVGCIDSLFCDIYICIQEQKQLEAFLTAEFYLLLFFYLILRTRFNPWRFEEESLRALVFLLIIKSLLDVFLMFHISQIFKA